MGRNWCIGEGLGKEIVNMGRNSEVSDGEGKGYSLQKVGDKIWHAGSQYPRYKAKIHSFMCYFLSKSLFSFVLDVNTLTALPIYLLLLFMLPATLFFFFSYIS